MSNIVITTKGVNMNVHSRHTIDLLSQQITRGVRSPSMIHWVISKEGGVVEARCKLNSRRLFYMSHGASPYLTEAIHIAAKKIEKQKRRTKRMKISGRHNHGMSLAA